MRKNLLLAAVVCCGFVAQASMARADESKITLGELPKGGLDAVKAMFPAGDIKGAARETEGDKTVFEVTLSLKGRNIDVTLGTDGKIQLIEREIAEKDLPAAVRQALEAKYPKATYKIVEQVDNVKDGKATLDFFETLLVTADQQKLEVQIDSAGKIKHEEKKTGDND